MATNVIRNLVVDSGKTFGKMQFLGYDAQKHYIDSKDTGKLRALRIRALSVNNAGENLIVIPLAEQRDSVWAYASQTAVEGLLAKLEKFELLQEIDFADVTARPRANKIDSQQAEYVRAELDWVIEAKDVNAVGTKAQAGQPRQ